MTVALGCLEFCSDLAQAVGAAGLEVIAHDAGPGFTSPEIGTVDYGYWELKVS